MRAPFSKSIDFNQMLVLSVFSHLALLTVVLFFPKPSINAKPTVPAFRVNLVEIPAGKKPAIKKRPVKKTQTVVKKSKSPVKKTKPPVKKVKKKAPVKKVVPNKLESRLKKVAPNKPESQPNKIVETLKNLDKKAAAAPLPVKKMLEELDQLAMLERPKKPVAKPKIKKPVLEETFREPNKLKDEKIEIARKENPQHAIEMLGGIEDLKMEEVVDPKEAEKKPELKKGNEEKNKAPVIENPLGGVEDLKMEEVVDPKEAEKKPELKKGSEEKNKAPVIENPLEGFEDLKMEEVVGPKEAEKKPELKKGSEEKNKAPVVEKRNLSKELKNLAKLDTAAKKDDKDSFLDPVAEENPGKAYESALEKFKSISVASSKVKVEIAGTKFGESKYQSRLRSLPDTPANKETDSDEVSLVHSEMEEAPGADAQSLYAGLIQEKINKNWSDPLAERHSKEVIISFYIFPKGNIDKPLIKQSSGVEDLDDLAVRAVLDSAPFPRFPKGLKKSNLFLSIYFKYVPKDE